MRFLFPLVVALWSIIAIAAEPHPSLPPPVIPECLGVNIHFTDPKPGELEMLAAAGFKWVRMDLTWAATERKKGEYDFSAYDRLVAALDRHKLRAIFILDYGNPLYADPGDRHPFTSRAGTAEFRAAYAAWAAAAVTHFQKRGYLWELWNEPNHKGFWKPQPDAAQYAALALAAGKAIRAAAPGEAIIGPATSTIDLPFLEKCFQAGLLEYLDAVSVHPYRQQAPDTAAEDYRSLRLLIRKYAPKDKAIPVVSGEWGYSTAYPAFAGKNDAEREEMQAQYVVREFLTNIANDVALSIWYDWRDDGDDPKEAEHRFGLVRRAYRENVQSVFEPKPAYLAVKTLTDQLGGFRFNKELVLDRQQRSPLLFVNADEIRLACWGRLPAESEDWLPASPGSFSVVDYLSRPRAPLQATGQGVPVRELRTGDAPIYLRPDAPNDLLRVAAAWSRLPLEYLMDVDKPLTRASFFRNPLDHPLTVKAPYGQLRTVQPGEGVTFERSVSPPRRQNSPTLEQLVLPGLAKFTQPSQYIAVTPLLIHPYPVFGNNRLYVRIENPAGVALSGQLRVDGSFGGSPPEREMVEPDSLDGIRITFAAGEREKIAELPLKRVPRSFHGINLAFEEGESVTTAHASATYRCVTLDTGDSAHAIVYRAISDGDPASKAEVDVKAGLPVSPPPYIDTNGFTLRYRFASGWKFFRLARSEIAWPSIIDYPIKFGLWLHGDGRGCQARLRFIDSTGQTFQSDGPKIDWQGWRFVTFPMRSVEDKPLAHWGGANDGKAHYPIKWDTVFLLDNISREPIEGEIYLSSPTLIY